MVYMRHTRESLVVKVSRVSLQFFVSSSLFLSVSDRELIEQFLYKVAMMAPLCGGIVFEDSIPLEFHYAKDVFLFR